MSIDDIFSSLDKHAKDVKINLNNIISKLGSPGLDTKQIDIAILASVYTTEHKDLIKATEDELKNSLSEIEIESIKSAVSMMAMNNVYYRFLYFATDKDYVRMPTNLSMDSVEKPTIKKTNSEVACLAVSAINGCKMCIDAHVSKLLKDGMSKEGIQSVIRIAAVISAVSKTLRI